MKDARRLSYICNGSRIRPILMTTIAMIAGMTPMALGLRGGDQIAPLGQARLSAASSPHIASLRCIVYPVAEARAVRFFTGSGRSE